MERKDMRRHGKTQVCAMLALMVLLLFILSGCNRNSEKTSVNSLADIYDQALNICMPSDFELEKTMLELCPKGKIYRLDDVSCVAAVAEGKMDCAIHSKEILNACIRSANYSNLKIVDEPIITYQNVLIVSEISQIPDLLTRVNEAIDTLEQDGILADMKQRWIVEMSETMPEIERAENPQYTLRVATYGDIKPHTFMKNNQLMGFDIELSYRIAALLDCDIQFVIADWDSMLSASMTGEVDIVASNIFLTEERKETTSFSKSYGESEICLLVREEGQTEDKKVLNHLSDIQGDVVMGNVTGTIYGDIIRENFPDAQVAEFTTFPDELAALSAGKIDGLVYMKPLLEYIALENPSLKVLPEPIQLLDCYFATAKNEEGIRLGEDFNAWLAEAREQGILDEMRDFWNSLSSPEERVDYESLSGENGTLDVAINYSGRPNTFLYDGKPTGYSIELITRYCQDRGYALNLVETNFSAFAAALNSGKIDFFCTFLTYTEERAQSIFFTDTIYEGGISVLVRNEQNAQSETKNDFWTGLRQSFEKTFIRENRWQVILRGFGVTMLITAGGFALANVLGALFCMLALSKYRLFHILADIYSQIMQGTPIVVILMILYYVIFGDVNISGVLVSIIGFGLVDGASLAQLFQGGISAVHRGQREAALALGLNRFEMFCGIVLPQMVRQILPAYFSQIIALMKGTSIVGYVAVIDLTKASDMIRSSTFEAFFPLISIALIYFIVSFLLLSMMKKFRRMLTPKRMKKKEVSK